MKRVLLVFLLAFAATFSQAQYGDDYTEHLGTLKLSAGYAKDFPGLGGYTVIGEYSRTLYSRLEGFIALKGISLSGYPRTASVNEYTKGGTIDLGMYFLPVESENHIIRVGLSYSFTFVKTRRSYPLMVNHGAEQTTEWQVVDGKYNLRGINIIGEYEYRFPESALSIGMRVALYKAYDRTNYIGPFVAVRL